jgi:hypothetical protein
MQITIDEYAKRYKMSKEMIRAKLRAGRLPHTTVDGMTYITVAPAEQTAEAPKVPSEHAHGAAEAVITLYRQENERLKQKIAELESKIDTLIGDKEQMLREERDRIEDIYLSRDEQLKSFLELVNAKLVQEGMKLASLQQHDGATDQHAAAAAPAPYSTMQERTELLYYLDLKQFTPDEKKTVKKRFAKAYGNDVRVTQQNGEFILDFSKYDYSDLLAR